MAEKLTPELLLRGYATGIFPMAERRDDPELFWVDPLRRGIFPLDGFHVSRSLASMNCRASRMRSMSPIIAAPFAIPAFAGDCAKAWRD